MDAELHGAHTNLLDGHRGPLGGEIPGLDGREEDYRLYDFLKGEDPAAKAAGRPRYLKWMPTCIGPCCLAISVLGCAFLVSFLVEGPHARPGPRRAPVTRARQPR